MRRISVGLLKKPIKQLNATQGKIVAGNFGDARFAEAELLATRAA